MIPIILAALIISSNIIFAQLANDDKKVLFLMYLINAICIIILSIKLAVSV